MKILITGASGYLGGRVSEHFANRNDIEVRIVSRKSPSFFNSKKIEERIVDWDNPIHLESVCDGVDSIIHLSGMNAQDSALNPLGSYKSNLLNTGYLLEAAFKKNVRKFIYFSTAHVYSSPLIGEITENSPVNNIHPYAASHKAAEDLVRYNSSLRKIDGYVVRLSNAYGPPLSSDANCWTLLVNDLCKQAVVQRKLILKSNGIQKRDFISISDVIRALDLLLAEQSEPSAQKFFNLGGDWSLSVLEMAQLIQARVLAVLNYDVSLEKAKLPIQAQDSGPLHFNIDKIKSYGFEISENRTEEIDRLLLFCKNNFSN
ncbi:SDR family oxidoreductase [Leptospira yasudae]|uniref:NAD-dependent epimerase/dehydratase family protein n=1 Tax=Leptospira yasudae TaxID=2202201 RepID=UPI001C4EB91C|nr:SDR family oxidoreductase [Leptospira yasudae]MBW0434136.1 SDR family oxidoreductase [Leptospira yasudae]